MQLIVVGMHRSGTSVLARLLNLMGAYFAPEGLGTGANQENPKGFWERRDVRALNDFVLHGSGCDWDRVSNFDASAIPASLLAEFDKRAAQIVLSMDASRPWFMKEPRLCLLLPLWRRVLEAPVCIHILRNPVEVASSLRTRNKIPIEAGLALWETYNRRAVNGMEGLPRVVMHHRSLMQDPVTAVASLHSQLEALDVRRLTLPAAVEIASFVNGELYREREGKQGLDAYADAPQLRLFERWSSGKSLPKGDRGLAAKERDALASYEASLPPLAVPDPVAPKKPVEAELREKAAASEREVHSLKEQVRHLQTLLGQREQQAAFFEAEFTALREASAARDSATMDIVAGLRDFAETERTRLAEEASHLAGKLETMAASRQQLSTEVESLRADLQAARDATEAAHKSSGDREQALRSKIEAMTSTLAAAEASRDALQVQASEQRRELVQLTRLYLDGRSAEARLQASVASAEAAKTDAQARVARIRAEADAFRRDQAKLIERNAREGKVLSDRLSASENQLKVRQQELALLREVNAFYVAEITRMDQRLGEIQAGAGNALAARLRRLRAWFGGRHSGASSYVGSSLELLRRSHWFDAEWYVSQYQDVASSGLAPEAHYLVRGAAEARNPSPGFDTGHYLASNPDVAGAGGNPLLHFIQHGEAEGRSPMPKRGA